MSESAIVAGDSSVYYGSGYWNEIPAVYHELNRRATGDPDMGWMQHLRQYHGRPFSRLLSLNCGNGWVERGLLAHGVAERGVGTDYAEDLLVTARAEAAAAGADLEYVQADINTFAFDLEGIDLVVNHAACHHIAEIDRVMRAICRLLPEDGVFVSWDYVGPHRNQYPLAQWQAVFDANQSLPPALRKDLRYPHLRSMLAGDPTEAIHSELILPVMRRYFDLEHVRYLGGGIAYELFNFNPPFHAVPRPDDEIARIMALDLAYLGDDPEANTLFAYVIARPRKAALADTKQLARWTAEELQRESAARAADGRYHPTGLLEHLYDRQYSLETAVATGRPPAIDGQSPSLLRFWGARWRRRLKSGARRARQAVRARRSPS